MVRTIIIAPLVVFLLFSLQDAAWAKDGKAVKSKKTRFEKSGQLVRDNMTGLLWPANGSLTQETFSWTGAFEYIAVLNKEKFCGYRDWRLPTREELLSLVEYARGAGASGSNGGRTVADVLN